MRGLLRVRSEKVACCEGGREGDGGERERECVCVCVCVREREREKVLERET